LFCGGNQTITSAANNLLYGINTTGDVKLIAETAAAAILAKSILLSSETNLSTGRLIVTVDPLEGDQAEAEQSRIDGAITELNRELSSFGITRVDIGSADDASNADILINVAETSSIGGAVQGVLGVTEFGHEITLIAGWSWYLNADPTQVGLHQFDFQTIVSHELGPTFGLGHITEAD